MSPSHPTDSAPADSHQAATGSEQAEDAATRFGREDPVYRHALYEAKIILGMWAIGLVITCTCCYLYGYTTHPTQPTSWGPTIGQWVGPLKSFNRDPASLTTPWDLGIPDWVVYGIAIPWLVCIVATCWFCLFVFHDDDLGDSDSECSREDPTGTEETSSAGDGLHG